jgi:hypothetical protein
MERSWTVRSRTVVAVNGQELLVIVENVHVHASKSKETLYLYSKRIPIANFSSRL